VSTLTPAQIGTYAAGAGFSGAGLRNAIAVALAESGGRTDAVGTNSDRWHSRDRGLWQINDHWHPEVSDAAAFDPGRAAAAAYRISGGGRDWSPWSTWKNGTAQAQFGRAQLAANQSAGSSSNAQQAGWFPVIPGTPDVNGLLGLGDLLGLGGITNPLEVGKEVLVMAVKTGAWLADPHNWQRVAMVAGGTVGILLALEMIGRSGAAGSTAQSVSAIPVKAARSVVQAGAAIASDGATMAAGAAAKAAPKA